MKKLLLTIFTVMLSLSCVLFVACSDKAPDNDEGSNQPVKVLSFTVESMSMEMFSTAQLQFKAENIYDTLVFSSSDESKATVSPNGTVTAHAVGKTTITVSGDGKSDTLSLNVIECDARNLSIYTAFSSINVYETEREELIPVVLYDGDPIEGGSFTYSVEGTAATYSGGYVQGVEKGTATITVNGSIGGISLSPVTVEVVVREKLTIDIGEDTTIYISEGLNGQNATTSYNLNTTVMLNNAKVENAVVEYVISQPGIISLNEESGLVTAVSVGETTVTATYTTEKDTTVTETVKIKVEKPLAEIAFDKVDYIANKSEALTFDLSAANYGTLSISKIKFDSVEVAVGNYSLDSGILKIASEALFNTFNTVTGLLETDHEITVYAESETESFSLTQEIYLVDYAISDKDDFVEFLSCIKAGKHINAYLTNNIDATEGENGLWTYTHTANKYFTGVLDGRGYTISNIWARNGVFFGLEFATIKNIGFVNVYTTSAYSSNCSLFAWNILNNSTLENVFIHGDLSSTTGNCGGLANSTIALTMKNVVVYVEFGAGTQYGAVSRDKIGSMDNCHFISNTCIGLQSSGKDAQGATLYRSAIEFKDASGNLSPKFDSYWEVSQSGVLTFKSAVQFIPAISGTADVSCSGFVENDGTLIAVAGKYNLVSSVEGAMLTVNGVVDGVTVMSGVLTIADTVAVGTEITLAAIDPVYGTELGTLKVTIVENQSFSKTFTELVAINRNDKIAVDISELGLGLANIKSVTFNGIAVDSTDYAINGNNFEVVSRNFVRAEQNQLIVTAIKDDVIYIVEVDVENLVDFAIGTAAEFDAWVNAIRATTLINKKSSKAYYAILTDNVTVTTTFGDDNDGYNGYAEGVLDGQGYTITNLTISSYGLFEAYTSFTMKNVAFVNLQSTKASSSAYIFYQGHSSLTLDNVYLDATFATKSSNIGISNNGAYLVITNSVIKLTYTQLGGNANVPAFRAGAPKLNNVFVISSQPDMYPTTATPVEGSANYGMYADTDELKSALTAETPTVTLNGFTDNPCWDVSSGYPVWKVITKN